MQVATRRLRGFTNQLTEYVDHTADIQFAIDLLKEAHLRIGKSFIIKERHGQVAIFLNYEAYPETRMDKSPYKDKEMLP